MGFQYTIEFREGKSNKVADALSPMPQDNSVTINDIPVITITDFYTIHSEVDHDPLQPLLILEKIWENISMDFIEALPRSKGSDTIWVIVDRLSKYAHFVS